jgi:hypothetical protein
MSLTVVEDSGGAIKVTGTATSSEKITDALIDISSIYWLQPTTAGHLCNLIGKNSQPIISMRCESDNISQQWDINIVVDGIYCDDMDSGTLYIYRR